MERVLRLMAEKNASDVYLSANTPILIKINGQILQLSDQPLTHDAAAPAAGRAADAAAARGARRHRRAEHRHRPAGRRQLPPVGASASAARSPRCSAASRSTSRRSTALNLPPMLSDAGAGKARPDPDGRRHRHRQEHDAGVDARAAQPAGRRPHPDDRGPDRVPVHATRSRWSTSARSAATRRSLQVGAEERAAPGAGLHPDRRDPRPRDDDRGDLVRAVGPPGAGHAARQQQLPRAGPDPVASTRPRRARRCWPTWPPACAPSSRSACCAPPPAAASPAVEVLLNTKLVSELIEQGDFTGVKEAMEKSLAEGSQTFEQDLARLITEGVITRDEGLAYADSPTNLMWRLQNDMTPVSRDRAEEGRARRPADLHRDHARRAAGRSQRAVAGTLRAALTLDVVDALHLAEQLIARRSRHAGRRRLPGAARRAAARRSASPARRCVCGPGRASASPTCGRCAAARRPGPPLAFAGHTDVVPTGPLEQLAQRPLRAHATATASSTAAAPPT